MQLIPDTISNFKFSNLNSGFFLCDMKGNVLNCNDDFSKKLGYSNKEELLILPINELYYNNIKESYISHFDTKNSITNFNLDFIKKEGTIISLTLNSFKTKDSKGNDYIINYCEDKLPFFEQLKQIEINEKLLNTIIDSNNIGLLLFEYNALNEKFEIKCFNDISKFYLSKNLNKKNIEEVFDFIDVKIIKEINATDNTTYDWELLNTNSNSISNLTINFLLINKDKPLISVNIIDNTKQHLKLCDTEFKLQEKTSYIHNYNHLINNNLNVIDSIIEINKIKLSDELTLDKLSGIQLKIKSIALVYQKNNQNENINSIDVKNYITEIAHYFRRKFYNENVKTIDFKLNINDEVMLSSVKSIHFGLIISELIYNSYKYDNNKSNLIIEMTISLVDNKFRMKYTDSGKGLPINVMDLKSGSFGFKLIESLIKQLNASYKLPVSKNFEFELEFNT